MGSHFECEGKPLESETTTSEFPNGEKATVEQILGFENEINPKDQDGESQSEIKVGKLTI